MIHVNPKVNLGQRVCWSCTVDISGKFRRRDDLIRSLQLYEDAVELIENQTDLFKIRDIGYTLIHCGKGYSYSAWRMAASAVHDMHGHGLVRCSKRDKNNKVCLYWEVVR